MKTNKKFYHILGYVVDIYFSILEDSMLGDSALADPPV